MKFPFFKEKPHYVRWILISLGIIVLICGAALGAAFGKSQKYAGKIYPGIQIDGIDVSGLTREQAKNEIQTKYNEQFAAGFKFKADDVEKTIANEEILALNADNMTDAAYRLGRSDNWLVSCMQILAFPLFPREVNLDYRLDKKLLQDNLKTAFSTYEKPAKNSDIKIKIVDQKQQTFEAEFTDSEAGNAFKYEKAISELETYIATLQNPTIDLRKEVDVPSITKDQASVLKDQAVKIVNLKNIVFKYGKDEWPIKWEDFTHWLKVERNETDEVVLALNTKLMAGQLEAIGQKINQSSVDAKFQIKDGRVLEFVGHKNGQELDIEASEIKINDEIVNNQNSTIEMVVKTTEPTVKTENANELGITEKIGVGVSNFSGSPTNRRHNIGVGAAKLNGLLIKPGEEFKLVPSLMPFDGSAGYLTELVIKGDKTVPEYGGGLCQVATTVFRSAIATGLPITERSPHAYRVSYYEPAGTDATIYEPHPDLRFINDTGNYILIQTFVTGNTMTVEFWGKSDGRKVSFEGNNKTDDLTKLKPVIFNITSPGPTKYVETANLKPGEQKRTESAHNGADAYFYRYITKADGTTEKETWSSHYSAWRAVVLVGLDPEKPFVPPTN
jgi:vancomycin resistance protein YoaR